MSIKVPTVKFNNGREIPVFGLGTWKVMIRVQDDHSDNYTMKISRDRAPIPESRVYTYSYVVHYVTNLAL